MGERDNDADVYILRRGGDLGRIKDWISLRPSGLRFAAPLLTGSFRSIEIWSTPTFDDLASHLENTFAEDQSYVNDDVSIGLYPHRSNEEGEEQGGYESEQLPEISGAQLSPWPKVHWARPRPYEAFIQIKVGRTHLADLWNAIPATYGDCFMGADLTAGDYQVLVNVGADTPAERDDCVLRTDHLPFVRTYAVSLTPPLIAGTFVWVDHDEV
jgi:hypothetical protein